MRHTRLATNSNVNPSTSIFDAQSKWRNRQGCLESVSDAKGPWQTLVFDALGMRMGCYISWRCFNCVISLHPLPLQWLNGTWLEIWHHQYNSNGWKHAFCFANFVEIQLKCAQLYIWMEAWLLLYCTSHCLQCTFTCTWRVQPFHFLNLRFGIAN